MKTFKQYLDEKHPEVSEGVVSKALTAGAIGLAGLGLFGKLGGNNPVHKKTSSASASEEQGISKKMKNLRNTERELMGKNMKKA